MSQELRVLGATTGTILYAIVSRDSDEMVWNNTLNVFQVRDNLQTDYAVPLVETPTGSRIWLGDFPTEITDDGTVLYNIDYYIKGGSTPSVTDDVQGGDQIYSDGTENELSPSVNLLLTPTEYDNFVPGSKLTTTQKVYFIKAATAFIQNYCNRIFVEQTNRTEILNAENDGTIRLSALPSSIISVTYGYDGSNSRLVDGVNFTWNAIGQVFPKGNNNGYYGDFYPYNSSNSAIKVIYNASSNVNYDIKQICAAMVMNMGNTADNLKPGTKTVGAVSITYKPTEGSNQVDFLGDFSARLQPYKRLVCI